MHNALFDLNPVGDSARTFLYFKNACAAKWLIWQKFDPCIRFRLNIAKIVPDLGSDGCFGTQDNTFPKHLVFNSRDKYNFSRGKHSMLGAKPIWARLFKHHYYGKNFQLLSLISGAIIDPLFHVPIFPFLIFFFPWFLFSMITKAQFPLSNPLYIPPKSLIPKYLL